MIFSSSLVNSLVNVASPVEEGLCEAKAPAQSVPAAARPEQLYHAVRLAIVLIKGSADQPLLYYSVTQRHARLHLAVSLFFFGEFLILTSDDFTETSSFKDHNVVSFFFFLLLGIASVKEDLPDLTMDSDEQTRRS